ncbi:hypothetical protein, partial [Streptomyces griseus]|uniref:hypothetical protein n=1 Tax=Streptomyces griseus TaxID=1911 RepID=UPI0036BA2334
MQRTRIAAQLLVGLTVTAVSGCVSVEPRAVPPPYPGATGPAQDVAPQIVQPPARQALEAVPEPGPSAAPPSSPAAGDPPRTRRTAPAEAGQRRVRPQQAGIRAGTRGEA